MVDPDESLDVDRWETGWCDCCETVLLKMKRKGKLLAQLVMDADDAYDLAEGILNAYDNAVGINKKKKK